MVIKKIGAIIQARTGSTRLPQKIKNNIGGKNILERCIEASYRCKSIDQIIIATTNKIEDDWIDNQFHNKNKVRVYRGSINDVLSRYAKASSIYKLDYIVRLTADDPFKPSWLIEKLINLTIKNNLDYASNTIKATFPVGLDIEIISKRALDLAFNNAILFSEREHVTPYIWKNLESFKYHSEELRNDYSWARLTIDYEEDLQRIKKLFDIYGENLNSKAIFEILDNQKNLKKFFISNKTRNEGYNKSIDKDFVLSKKLGSLN